MPRLLVRLGIALALMAVSAADAAAQNWPTRPIRLIVAYAPGGVTDTVARLVAQPLSESLGQSIVVENKPGAAGMIGAEAAATSSPDGYTFLMYVDAYTILPSIMKHVSYDPLKSFAPITILGRGSHVIVVHPSLPVRSLKELIAYAKAHPGELSYASPGLGSPQSLSVEMIKKASGIHMVHIPYKGGGQAIADVASGQVKVGVLGMAPVLPHIQSGKLIALAVTGGQRSPLLPDVPTVAEAALPGFETAQWQGMVVPVGTPEPIVARMHDELVKVMARPDIIERMKSIGMDNTTSATPEAFRAMIESELARWPAVVQAAGIEPE
jgi:tripartite-type tricarboxylate transporter receptor subunit TctC